MTSQELKKLNLPDSPGIYFFREGKNILYVGKATSLRDRVRSYFNKDLELTRGASIMQMISLADNVSFIETDSVLEALILEADQIKKHRPTYNVLQKDDKSFNFVVITRESFPSVLLVRGKELAENSELSKNVKYQFGPFPLGGELKEALKIIRRIFPYRTKCIPYIEQLEKMPPKLSSADKANRIKPCFDSQIGLCPGVCSGRTGKMEYEQTIKNLRDLFRGRKKDVIRNLEKEMSVLAEKKEFEKAALIKKRIFSLKHIQDVSLIKYRRVDKVGTFRIEAYDIAHLGGNNTVGVMTVISDGESDKNSYRKFTMKGEAKDITHDIANLREMLSRRFNHSEWPLPNLIVVDGGKAQRNASNVVLQSLDLEIPIVSVLKNEFHQPKEIQGDKKIISEHEREIIYANSEAHRFAIHFHRQVRRRVL